MARALNVSVTQHSYEDAALAMEAVKLKLESKAGILEFGKFEKLYQLSFKDAKLWLHKFLAMDPAKRWTFLLKNFLLCETFQGLRQCLLSIKRWENCLFVACTIFHSSQLSGAAPHELCAYCSWWSLHVLDIRRGVVTYWNFINALHLPDCVLLRQVFSYFDRTDRGFIDFSQVPLPWCIFVVFQNMWCTSILSDVFQCSFSGGDSGHYAEQVDWIGMGR